MDILLTRIWADNDMNEIICVYALVPMTPPHPEHNPLVLAMVMVKKPIKNTMLWNKVASTAKTR